MDSTDNSDIELDSDFEDLLGALDESKFVSFAKVNSRKAFFIPSGEPVNMARRFPGPAGLLPKLTNEEQAIVTTQPLHPLTPKYARIIAADKSKAQKLDTLETDRRPWIGLLKHLGLDSKRDDSLLNLMNIQWMRQKVLSKLGVSARIPFLALVVMEDPKHPRKSRTSPAVRLMDATGTIVAAVESSITELVPGTALAVQNVRLLHDKLYFGLNITSNNIICLASIESDAVKLQQFSEFSPEKIKQDYENMFKEDKGEEQDYTPPSKKRREMTENNELSEEEMEQYTQMIIDDDAESGF